MANTIQHKRSSVSGVTPAASGLSQGELAINIADGKFYTKNSSNTVINLGVTSISGTYVTPSSGNFFNYLAVNGVPVSVSGHSHISVPQAQSLVTAVFNKTASTIPKFSAVYINGGQGDQPTIQLAIAAGEGGSSRTYGITAEAITSMSSGTVIVAGALSGVNTDQFNPTAPIGDVNGTSLYLSPAVSGGLTSTKPYAPNHLVYMATIVRTHQNEGVVEVRVQNGYELEELHNVAISGVTNGQFLYYDGASDLWQPNSNIYSNGTNIGIGTSSPLVKLEVAGDAYANNILSTGYLTTNSLLSINDFDGGTPGTISIGEFTSLNQPYWTIDQNGSGNFSTLSVNDISVSLNGHTHTSSDITNFNSSVSGLLPTIANSGDNRVLTSTGSTVGVNAETNFTFNGSLLNVTGSGSFSNNIVASGFVRSGGTSSQFLKANGSVDSTSYQPLLTNPVTGTGIVNHIPYWNSSSGIVADSGQLVWDATNNRLGIGTSAPSGTLDIIGNTHTRGISYFHENNGVTDTTSSIQRFSNNELRLTSLGNFIRLHGDAGKIIIQSTTVGTEIGGFGYIMFYPGLAEKARMTADGDFGIGTSAPSARLHVIGTGIFTGDVRTSGSFIASSGSAATPSFEFVNDADTGMFNPSANVIGLSTSGVERLRIDNIGRIGIGTSSPSGQLHVNGTGIFSSGLAVNTTNFNFYTAQNDIKTSAASISGSVWIQNDLNFYTPNETNQYQRGQITSNGDAIFNTLGVGEKRDDPGNSVVMDTNGLVVNNAAGIGGSACQLLGDYGAIIENTLVVNNNSAGSAKVGIGTSTPTHSLDVDGNIRCRDLYLESVSSPSIVSSGLTLNLSNSQLFTVNLNSNISTVTISNTPTTSGVAVGFSLIFTADGTARSVTWPSGIKWAGGTSPALTSTSGKIDVLSFISTNSGTNWLGFVGGQNY